MRCGRTPASGAVKSAAVRLLLRPSAFFVGLAAGHLTFTAAVMQAVVASGSIDEGFVLLQEVETPWLALGGMVGFWPVFFERTYNSGPLLWNCGFGGRGGLLKWGFPYRTFLRIASGPTEFPRCVSAVSGGEIPNPHCRVS